MQWIRTAEPEIIKQVWIQAVEQKELFWNNVHKFSQKIQTEHLWRHVFWCVRARCAQRQGRPFLWRWHWHGWGRRAQTRGPHGYDSHWFCWLLLALVSCSLQKPIMNMFLLLAKRLRLPQVAMECHERIHTGCLWELWRNHKMKILMVTGSWWWRHGWIFFSSKGCSNMWQMCFKPFTVSDSMDPTDENSQRNSSIRKRSQLSMLSKSLVIWESWFLIIAVIAVIAVIAKNCFVASPTSLNNRFWRLPRKFCGWCAPSINENVLDQRINLLRHHPKLWDSWQTQLEGESSHLHCSPTTILQHPRHLHHLHQPRPSQSPCPKPGAIRWPNPQVKKTNLL